MTALCYTPAMPTWPDALEAPSSIRLQELLAEYWQTVRDFADLLARDELLLAEETTARLRRLIIEMMLAANGIMVPPATRHLNGYLGASQRMVLERTLVAPSSSAETWLARAVALTTIYRWYAPQLVARYALAYPQQVEEDTWAHLLATLPDWPEHLQTE